jgi:hypothetical protein
MNRRNALVSWMKLGSACALAVGLVACGGGSDDDGPATATPDFAGRYQVTMNKTQDSCNSGVAQQLSTQQTVTQAGRTITLVSNEVTASGQVDGDNRGFSVSAQTTVSGVPVSYGTVFRMTDTPGLYQAGLSIVATSGSARCTVTYGGEARRL